VGDVIAVNFRDRRRSPESRAAEVDTEFKNKADVHAHLRDLHGYGGPRSQTRAELDRIHNARHADPDPAVGDPFRRPHAHR